ncbi:MAG TPA: nucleotidyltransferase family protein [Candidatus Binatia bacterium]
MNRSADEKSCWPTPQQKLLLRAALARGDEAHTAWTEWKPAVHGDDLDLASKRMLPLLYRNLRSQNVADPAIDSLKDVYRTHWLTNQILLRHVADILRIFHAAGMQTLILKGAPLTLLYYRDYGVRPMADIDLLVPAAQALQAVAIMTQSGWTRADAWPELLHDSYVLSGHAACFVDRAGQQVDLHWHVMPECCDEDADRSFWSAAVPAEIHGVRTLTLNSSDHLLHVCVHGLRWEPVAPFRWVADAMAIINADAALDWERLAAQARARRLAWPMKEALRYLRDEFGAPVPEGVLRAIESAPTAWIDRVEYRYKTADYRKKPLGYLPVHWFNYRRREGAAGLKPSVAGFVQYVERLCGAENLQALLVYAARRRLRKIPLLKNAAGGPAQTP